jgi:hypothetical protein
MNDETKPADETEEPETPDVFAGDDPKAKFREALARKAGKGGAGDKGAESTAKVGSAHGPAKASRTFRRKSGG